MKSSYQKKDVEILLKNITGQIEPLSAIEREKKIQSGIHYSELLPVEYQPTKEYMQLYYRALSSHAFLTAQAVANLAQQIWERKNGDIVLVSLARAGTPIGILLKRYLESVYSVIIPHYTISIIRDRGIDKNAINYILKKHRPESIQFVDGWIGKGAIAKELKKAMKSYPDISDELAVLADPAKITTLYGTSEDFLIPSACLNAPVSGLFSRTVLNNKLIKENDFHGAVYYSEMEKIDVSYSFIFAIEDYFSKVVLNQTENKIVQGQTGLEEVIQIANDFKIQDINLIKPGIGETTRVLLRRVPWKVLIRKDTDPIYISHIERLCKEKEVEIIFYPLQSYRVCAIIRQLTDI